MKIIVGLGNPGAQYETSRHNAGFLALDRLVDRWNASGPQKKSQGTLFEAHLRLGDFDDKVLLVQPQTFMNLSGRCVAPLVRFYQIKPEDLIVIYDDLDLEEGTFRVKKGGGSAGHNGIRSIDQSLGKDFTGYYKVRIGIGHPRQQGDSSGSRVVKHVLDQFSNRELKALDLLLDDVSSAVELVLQGKHLEAMNQFHRKPGAQEK